uniref:Uncharacterized protein n=1 Tax=Romanomermis culicivorax TaxID=13658 RepID=A0A915IC10_ROMCU
MSEDRQSAAKNGPRLNCQAKLELRFRSSIKAARISLTVFSGQKPHDSARLCDRNANSVVQNGHL